MLTSDFDYFLPEKFIAQNPATPRDSSKLMCFDTKSGRVSHLRFHNIRQLLKEDDCLVLNESKVIPARILFEHNGKECEIFILKKNSENVFECFVRPGKIFKVGEKIIINKSISVYVKSMTDFGGRIVEFSGKNIDSQIKKLGHMPLPPYIKNTSAKDIRYQTVYASQEGSVAAPTAGLHFTNRLLGELKNKRVDIEKVVLHVGLGTFMPVKTDLVKDHRMHSEFFTISGKTADNLNLVKKNGGRIIAVGTTSVRVLESTYNKNKGFTSQSGDTDIFIYPGSYNWKVVDGLVTNFHLPKSTLLMLVSSFLEHKGVKDPVKKLLELYEIAKANDYRFYSFGDAMFIY